ncbi:dethiobiotin synthase [Mesonia aestuariivivens]|uniref:ATP-dependent dethiobiotin synthetase BioD n=1 Tax=Mesonia aestuariivivens TaxID=2796128 RepID=A0ABS6VXN6_9FLAO|nr:dethiobiotin synthase [Mesonia aestuariivivens]MBW2960354.1 dethiobiotin synthase [Mesonia aestuariivivens]
MKHIFVTGIGTEVGKTVASSIVTEALKADYFKPIQAGDLENSDTHKVQQLVSNKITQFFPNAYALKTPMSPHAAAEKDHVQIKAETIERPISTNDNLVIEGAGGLLVPLNNTETIADLMHQDDKIIVVSRHYLGSINHTLLTIEALKTRGLTCAGIIFSGEKQASTENIITKMAGVPIIGRIEQEPYFDKNVIREYANLFRENLQNL